MPHASILRCADGTFYTGSTVDLARRLHEHHTGDGANDTRERARGQAATTARHPAGKWSGGLPAGAQLTARSRDPPRSNGSRLGRCRG
ncbi:MAG TPA: GIY-YIG nuclease family protein [Plantibacter sp.]|uniref:GIY-YIG nuclease family protein n=1 Tax=unclassified Plantibacter TaxID=2624265 RepID=UPI002CFEEF89|nr:GIY-YIG nuclease family protein [Plantibacter sp.]